jgi:hypothetical protein
MVFAPVLEPDDVTITVTVTVAVTAHATMDSTAHTART